MKIRHGLFTSIALISSLVCALPAFAAERDQASTSHARAQLTGDKSKGLVSCKKQCEIDRNQCKVDSKTPGNPTIKQCVQLFNECKRTFHI